ncbi:valyl-tRNA synthetase [Humidesulfovibrio mexicanus]|uniref:Valine--tRNA ligase n=1 Tax=Humidesulfovibrio mexicanus TaxID=147047 RepID=A0A239CV32_9BACT|nr:valine--tRNA ligase [Humidesulfovibrio mexicanus]SNS23799.1 valyl-tRNA synthetase [Humidesulfovibrio mexicanus]
MSDATAAKNPQEVALPKGYEPADVEARWGRHWVENKTFTPDPQDVLEGRKEPFSIVIPPPNVTGALHMGHALDITIQDILCRFMRQQGKSVLWVPGTDHAGIATQNVVERQLKKEGKKRDDLGREAFIERVWDWKKEYGDRILNQIRSLGASVDWDNLRFTMDEGLSKAVREVFVRLYGEGLIYKGNYIVNWCNRCHTALADDEVEHAPKKGKLYRIRYKMAGGPLADGAGELIVATTRPETLLGDVAVAVHPEDERYASAVGRKVVLPLVGKEIPVIADAYVDREFGTGCLKITPAHDMNDWALSKKHDLPVITVIDDKGLMNDNAPEAYRGMACAACRQKIVEDLEAAGLLVDIADHDHSVGECYRCKSVIEPHVSEQWFVKVGPLAKAAREAVPAQTQIFPPNWEKTYFEWLDNIRDWCISRQIWWGHRIPAWTCQACGEMVVATEDPAACPKCGGALTQEEDVLDTWFSSALWPFSTMGWPDRDADRLKAYYPTSVLVTGFDILFFWVARMMMMGIHFMGEVPFKHVYLHALVRDEQGKKMSKSTGNVIDPLAMTAKYGTDAMRFTLASFAAMGRDIKLSEKRIEGYRHFVNKIWNSARFALMNLPEAPRATLDEALTNAPLANRWILHRLEEVKDEVESASLEYRFNDIAQSLYRFIWSEFCDWYVEMAKGDLYGEDEAAKDATRRVLLTVLSETMVLLHPVMPFVTQEIWSVLPGIPEENNGRELALLPYPQRRPGCRDAKAARDMAFFQGLVGSVRTIRTELCIDPARKLPLVVDTEGAYDGALSVLADNVHLIAQLARVDSADIGPGKTGPRASGTAVVEGARVFVPLKGIVDFGAEVARLDKELGKLDKQLAAITGKLSAPGFANNAPADIVAAEREKLAGIEDARAKLAELQERLKNALAEGE